MNNNKKKFNPRFVKRGPEHRINELIDEMEVRLSGGINVEPGIYPIKEALALAAASEMDLVEISPNAKPPVCKIIDYNKFLYEKKKKEKEMKAKAKTSEVKEIRFTPNTDDHDIDFKSKHAEKFLKEGNKVKCMVQFRGRSIVFQDRGELLLLNFAEKIKEFGSLESMPKLEGRKMIVVFVPKKVK